MAAVAEAFLEALAVQDFPRLASVFSDDVHLRALLPGGLYEWEGTAKLEAAFTRWFGNTQAFEIVDREIGVIGPKLCLRWRIRVQAERIGPGSFVVEQEAYADLDDDRLSAMSLLCSGYLAESGDG
jgi:SnoaL-like domain